MKIIKPYYEIVVPLDGSSIIKHIEQCGRVCYKSEDKITEGSDDSAGRFVRSLIQRGHESVLEHYSFSVRFVCDRGVSHEIVRHRLASYSQESTRYCNYSSGKFNSEITVIKPRFLAENTEGYEMWKNACERAEEAYFNLLDWGCSPQEARAVLPNSLKTEIVMTANIREWRHFLKLRTATDAHPQMRELTIPLLLELQEKVPVLFGDIKVKDSE
ncbi:MAG: FAD-dependent thymidylate synthase [Hominilimicola sp.]